MTDQGVNLEVETVNGQFVVKTSTVGIQGADGKSAYQAAVAKGFVGTEENFNDRIESSVNSADAAQIAAVEAQESAVTSKEHKVASAGSADLSAAWAESGTAPGGAGTKSAKTHAENAGGAAVIADARASVATTAADDALRPWLNIYPS